MNLPYECDILIIGGGTGGCAAAMAATALGYRVILTEETDWIGGQLTNQAVPPDEHPWIESFGCTRRYRFFREGVREAYRDHTALTEEARRNFRLNPGGGWVSRLCFEPKIGLAVLEQMLAPAAKAGLLKVLLNTVPVSVHRSGQRIETVEVQDLKTGRLQSFAAPYVLDATELGDLLSLSDLPYAVGQESRAETGEPSATEQEDRTDVQGFTWCLAMGFDPGGSHTIEKPRNYEFWRNYAPVMDPPWPGNLFDWTVSNPITWKTTTYKLFGHLGMFTYRQIIDSKKFSDNSRPHDVTIVNWAQNDCLLRVVDQPKEVQDKALEDSRQLSLSLLYWLQTEAPRDEGGYGYPELFAAGDVVGTADGLAKAPYHRESRRIRAEFTVTENHVGVLAREGENFSEEFPDSVGIGAYRIDLHPSTTGRNSVDLSCYPFQIPLGSLIPKDADNLLPACKNLGVTHITNGAYRLHPVEWNIGEAAGILAAYCLKNQIPPSEVRAYPEHLKAFQMLLMQQGIELEWPKMRAL